MKKITLCMLLFAVCASKLKAQATNLVEIPVKDNAILFESTVKTDSTIKAAQLFLNAKSWFVDYFKNANAVIQLDDKDAGKIKGKGTLYFVYNGGMAEIRRMYIDVTIDIDVKDGKYRYKLYDFVATYKLYSALSNDLLTTNTTDLVKNYNDYLKKPKGMNKKLIEGYYDQVNKLLISLNKAMSLKSNSDF